jgi:hypothetical protein
MKKRRIPVGYIGDRYEAKGETWAEKRSDIESHLEDFFIKASNLTRPDGIRLMKLDFNRSKFIDEANNLLDELEKAYHSEGFVLHVPEGAKDNYE